MIKQKQIIPSTPFIFILCLLIVACWNVNAFGTDGVFFLDTLNRTVILRGFVTITHNGPGVDEVNYTLEDYKRMKAMGANVQSIRIFAGLIGAWPGKT